MARGVSEDAGGMDGEELVGMDRAQRCPCGQARREWMILAEIIRIKVGRGDEGDEKHNKERRGCPAGGTEEMRMGTGACWRGWTGPDKDGRGMGVRVDTVRREGEVRELERVREARVDGREGQ